MIYPGIIQLLLATLLVVPGRMVRAQPQSHIQCAYYSKVGLEQSVEHIGEEEVILEVTEDPDKKIIFCESYCYTAWQDDGKTQNIMLQGCWDTSGQPNDCDKSACLADKKPPRARNTTKFCCCNENLCNQNYTDVYKPESDASTNMEPPKKENLSLLMYVALSVVFVILAMGTAGVSFYLWKKKPKKKGDIENGSTMPPPQDYSLDKLNLVNIIGQGKYGCVWRGVIDDKEVAVKVFPAHNRNYFINEHEVYKAAGDHSSILKYFGGGEYIRIPGRPEYLLLLSLEQESLQEYLKNNTLDLLTLGKMAQDIAKGLAHLHSDANKPCIAHRDLNSKNILVRRDLSCCICDLGLAFLPKNSESKALSECGTLRYMAPEVLEGAVNLRDTESALKQIDIYALGLVLWELGTRCTDMLNGEPQAYAPPFFKETGENPTLEQMQTLVSRRKVRPLWPVAWKDSAAARLLCETAEDCWDQDAEARLTSLCVVERFTELPHLRGRVLHPMMHPPSSPTPLFNNNHIRDHPVDMSGSTVETLLSPTEENFKNSNQLAACILPHQPYQGRNSCLERNLLTGSSDSLLIDKSSKHCNNSDTHTLITNEFLNYQVNNRATPIPYLQNAVYGVIPKQNNTASQNLQNNRRKKFKWTGLKNFLNSRKFSANANLRKETQVKLKSKIINGNGKDGVTTSLLGHGQETTRPSTLPLSIAQDNQREHNNISGVHQILKRKNSLSRQRSLEKFQEVFSSTLDLSRLKDPTQRVKTPGDVPPSVRKTRGRAATESARFSLYDDRMMFKSQWGSAPDLEPPALSQPQINKSQDSGSVSSF